MPTHENPGGEIRIVAAAAMVLVAAASMALAAPALDAKLVMTEAGAREGSATVQVSVSGIEMVDPAQVQEKPREGQGHLHYQVDQGPIIATPTTKLSFHGLSAGVHRIGVTLVGNDHLPIGPREELEEEIPERVAAGAM
jgi:hypothetical protein